MAKKRLRYRFNLQTLAYEKVKVTWQDRIKRLFARITWGFMFAILFMFLIYSYFDAPKEKILKRENAQLKLQYEILNRKLSIIHSSLEDLQQRDDNIYRVIFEAEPISKEQRNAGFGGVNRYKNLEGIDNSEMIIETAKRVDKLAKQLYIQSKSFDEIFELSKQKEKMLSCIPAIQPISNQDLTRVASGFGYRIHPIYKTSKMHTGMDFTSPVGTDIYATGNGVVKSIEMSNKGYGYHVVISHGFGYETLYAHMSKIKVRAGQAINRGEVLGVVGNTGTSSGPHLHYEVIKDGNKIDPLNFYYNDLSPDEFEKMIEISSSANQSFD